MVQLRIYSLGAFRVTQEHNIINAFDTDKTRALLVYLAVESERPHRRDYLAGLLWSDQPAKKALHNLRQALSSLRKALPGSPDNPPYLLIEGDTVQFNPDSDYWLDVNAFENESAGTLANYARQSQVGRLHIRRLRHALELYKGHFLDQFFLEDSILFEEWATLRREAISRRAIEGLSILVEYYERRAEYNLARQAAIRLVELAPWVETAHGHIMRLYAMDGQWNAVQAQYYNCRRYLKKELGVEPSPETQALFQQIRLASANNTPLSPGFPITPTNLPWPSAPFVGRETELDEIAKLLADMHCHLISLLGPGGIGKTRLAIEAAREQVGIFPDGVFFVPLSALSSEEGIITTIAEILGIAFPEREEAKERLFKYLSGKKLLLVLDSFEHLLLYVPLVVDILKIAPGIVILVTSRERLNLQEEILFPLDGLSYPTQITELVSSPQNYSAVVLFLKCAQRVKRNFSLSSGEQADVIRICQLLDGLPLGIELAAGTILRHTCQEIANELTHSFNILSTSTVNIPARHRSLQAAFEISWQLLTETERMAFSRLSVFHNGFTTEAVFQVTGVTPATLESLQDKSLLRRSTTTPDNRYDMHEAIRQFATEKLKSNPSEYKQTLVDHTNYFCTFMQTRSQLPDSEQLHQTTLVFAPEIENARAAWLYAIHNYFFQEAEGCIDSLYHYYHNLSRYQEGADLFEQAIQQWRGNPEQERRLGLVLSRQGALYQSLGNYVLTRALLEESLSIFQRMGILDEQVFCLTRLANVYFKQGKTQEAEQLARKIQVLSKDTDNIVGKSSALHLLGAIRSRAGKFEEAKILLEESLDAARTTGNPRLILTPLNQLGDIEGNLGDYEACETIFLECLALSRELNDQFSIGVHLNNLGTVYHVLEKYKEAKAYYQESLDICRKIGDQDGQAIALSNLGEIAIIFSEHEKAHTFFQEGLEIGRAIQSQWTIMANLTNLGETACILHKYQEALEYLTESAQLAIESHTLTMLMRILVNLGKLYSSQGDKRRAIDLLTLVIHQPACEPDIRNKSLRLLVELGVPEPGASCLSFDTVVADLLDSARH